ncbi:MAG: PfkB family carbohydrate kinase [Prevotellamassilia sp.]|nr:PfkB family carbohydrate kinase [Prevotellamassilia sp.]
MNKICCIGHITHDKIITPETEVDMPGGTSYYFAHAMYHLNGGKDFQLVTSLAETDMQAVTDLRQLGINVSVVPSRHTVYFENKYGENQNNRTQRVLAKADPFTVESLKNLKASVFHLGSLLADDFSLQVIESLAGRGEVSVDSQGYLREVRGEKVYAVDWKEKREALRHIDVLKVNEYEMEVLTGHKDAHDAALQLAEWGVKEVCVTLGNYGSVILEDNHFYDICAYPPLRVVDATGCGDTYSTGYLYMRSRGANPSEAGHFAAAMSTLKLEANGPFARTEDDVWHIIKEGR